MYRTHASSLIKTGEGVCGDDAPAEGAHHEYSDCYIPVDGPKEGTTDRAKNIWRELFEFNFSVSFMN